MEQWFEAMDKGYPIFRFPLPNNKTISFMYDGGLHILSEFMSNMLTKTFVSESKLSRIIMGWLPKD